MINPTGKSVEEQSKTAEVLPSSSAEVQDATEHTGAGYLHTVVQMVRRIVRADAASLVSFSPTDNQTTWRSTSGFSSQLEGTITVNALKAFLDETRTGEPVFLEGIGKSTSLPAADFPVLTAEGIRDAALVPLRARSRMLGALVVGFRRPHKFTVEEKGMLESLAEMAALALDNAKLLETVVTAKRIWEQTFDAIADGVIVHNVEMRIVRCNASAAEMMNLTPQETIGRTCAEAFSLLFGERAAAFHLGQSVGAASSFELQAEDGRRYLVSVAPLDDPTGQSGSVITWSNVTQLSEMQEQLSRTRKLATVGQLAAGVAHEINNPLAAITACSEAILRDLKDEPELAREAESREWTFYLEEIVRQAMRCKEITRGLLDLSRQRRAQRTATDINTLVAQCARLAEERKRNAEVDVVIKLDMEVGDVATDAGMVRQVLDNLLSNALDAVGERGRVTISTRSMGERVAVEVSDTGHGIAPELLVRIFDPFFTTKEPGKGSGLGLAISYTLAEALGGALTVESKPEAGSRFRLWLPRRAPEEGGNR
jgi:two-component system NtrC family sensor kinase